MCRNMPNRHDDAKLLAPLCFALVLAAPMLGAAYNDDNWPHTVEASVHAAFDAPDAGSGAYQK